MQPVLILGAGINGCAVARDLALNGVPVCLVDIGDIGRGATARSSRLIHGGLRYLEYRDTDLVRESLRERDLLLQTAPQFVKPLRLRIPIAAYTGGLLAGAARFTGLSRLAPRLTQSLSNRRGLLAVKAGLGLYDWLCPESSMPRHTVRRTGSSGLDTGLDRRQFPWVCEYYDAQMKFPERFILALLHDATRAASDNDQAFQVLPYHRAIPLGDGRFRLNLESGIPSERPSPATIKPSFIVNATGAWGDRTIEALGLDESQLFAGTKGSHLFTRHSELVSATKEAGVYAEADDGRLVFILPLAGGVLIGTTDDPFDGDPGSATATTNEVQYLIDLVNSVFPSVGLTRDHVEMQHAGIRPLPRTNSAFAAAIPRGHSIHESSLHDIPLMTLIGGKLTTCRALAEEVTTRILEAIHKPRQADTAERPIPGAELFPRDPSELANHFAEVATEHQIHADHAQTVAELVGHLDAAFSGMKRYTNIGSGDPVPGTSIPLRFARWSIDHEYVTRLSDLVERRLMLVFQPDVSRSTLRTLGKLLDESGRLPREQLDSETEDCISRLSLYHGKPIPD